MEVNINKPRNLGYHRKIMPSTDKLIFYFLSFLAVSFVAAICLIPFVLIVSGSITKESSIFQDGYRIIPKEISFKGYEILTKSPDSLLQSYFITILITACGAALGLFFGSMTAYVLLRKDFLWRNAFAFFFFFTTLFSGGLVPWYILMVKYLGMKDNLIALLLPGLFNVFYILLMRNFMKSIPESIMESARIDGASDFTTYSRIVLPLSTPALATIGMFIALGYWNEWYSAMLFMDNDKYFPLQYYLYRILNSVNFAAAVAGKSNVPLPDMPTESFKLVMTVVSTGPILLLYPFIQKYFIRGITVGAVKG